MKFPLVLHTLDERNTPAALDLGYGANGLSELSLPTSLDVFYPHTIADNDGRIVSAAFAGERQLLVRRLNANGSLETTFAGDGVAEITLDSRAGGPFFNAEFINLLDLAIDSQNRIVVTMEVPRVDLNDSTQRPIVARLTADGKLDSSFGTNGLARYPQSGPLGPLDLMIDSQDRIIIAIGDTISPAQMMDRTSGGTNSNITMTKDVVKHKGYITRLNADGSLDTTYGQNGIAVLPPPTSDNESSLWNSFNAVSEPNGGVILLRSVGRTVDWYGDGSFGIPAYEVDVTRVLPDGQVDAAYRTLISAGDKQSLRVLDADRLADGSLLITTNESGLDYGTETVATVFKLTPSGKLDINYGTRGFVTVPSAYLGELSGSSVELTGETTLVFSAIAPTADNRVGVELVRITPQGAIDKTFGKNGLAYANVGRNDGSSYSASVVDLPGERIALANGGQGSRLNGSVKIAVVDLDAPSDTLPAISLERLQQRAEFARITVYGYQNIFPEEANKNTNTIITDVTGDGVNDTVFTAGVGNKPFVRIIDGRTNRNLIEPQLVYEETFLGGVRVDAVDLDGDGTKEIVTAPGLGGGARVQVFGISSNGLTTLANFFSIEDPNFRGGARVAMGDVNGDTQTDMIVVAGEGGGPRVAVYDGGKMSLRAGTPVRLVNDFFAFGGADVQNLRNGVYVAAGDFDGDGRDDLAFGGGPGGGPRVKIISGADLFRAGPAVALAQPIADFFAGDSNLRDGAPLRTRERDGKLQLVAGTETYMMDAQDADSIIVRRV